MSTTRWKDNQDASLDAAVNLLMDEVSDDETTNIIHYENWSFRKSFEQNETMTANGRQITFNMVHYSYDQITSSGLPLEDRTIPKKGFVIAYNNGMATYYIIDQNSSAKKILRKMLGYSGRQEIEKFTIDCTADFLIWLINKVYTSDNAIETTSEDEKALQLEAIKGFRGDTEDQQTKVTATGESVMNIISTLSFLLESRYLNQVKVDISYPAHENISLKIQSGTIDIDRSSYQGAFENCGSDLIIAKLHLLVYLEILPLMQQAYQQDLENGTWSQEKYIDFLNKVADELSEKIKNKINGLNEGIPREQC